MRAKGFTLILLCLIVAGAALAQTPAPQDRSEPAWDGTYRRIDVPILRYQSVSDTADDSTVSPATFRAHMDYLFFQGYTPISLYDLDTALLTGTPLPTKPVVLTFDDGTVDHFTTVLPVLRQYSFPATFFVITGAADAQDPAYLSWDQIRAMSDAGMDMESQTKSAPDLRGREYDFLVYELLGSRESLAAYTGKVSHLFAYPNGQYDNSVLAVLNTMPIWRAVTTNPGDKETNDNRLELPRLSIHRQTDVAALEQLLDGK